MSKILNSLADEAGGDDEKFRHSVVDHAKQTLGTDALNEIANASNNNDDAFIQGVVNKIKERDQYENIGSMSEDNPVVKGMYSVGSLLGKLDIARPPVVMQTQPTQNNHIGSVDLNNRPSAMESLRGSFPNQAPMMDTYTKDIVQGEKLKAAAKMWTEQNFPKAYKFISSVVPSDVPGMAVDAAVTEKLPSIPVGGIADKASSSLGDMASLNREKSLINETGLTGTKAAKDIDNLEVQKIGNTLERYGLADKLKNPIEIKNALSGKKEIGFDAAGNEITLPGSGVINQLGDELRMGGEHLTNKLGPIDIKEIANNVLLKLTEKYASESSGVPFTGKEYDNLQKQIYGILKVDEGDNMRPFNSLIDSKRSSAKFYFDLKNDPATPIVAGPSLTAAHKAIWDEIDNYVNQKAPADPDIKAFSRQNSDMSDLLKAEDMLSGSRAKAIAMPSAADVAIGMGAGYAAGEAMGHPYLGMAAMGGIGAARGMVSGARASFPARVANIQQYLSNKIAPITSIAPNMDIPLAVNVPNRLEQYSMRRGLVQNLADYEIPRTVKDILANKQSVLAKVAQSIKGPDGLQYVQMLDDALNKHPDKLSSILPVLGMQFPNLFQADKYNRWDNKILDPALKQKAYQDVQNSGLSNTEKVMLQNGLNRDGTLIGF